MINSKWYWHLYVKSSFASDTLNFKHLHNYIHLFVTFEYRKSIKQGHDKCLYFITFSCEINGLTDVQTESIYT